MDNNTATSENLIENLLHNIAIPLIGFEINVGINITTNILGSLQTLIQQNTEPNQLSRYDLNNPNDTTLTISQIKNEFTAILEHSGDFDYQTERKNYINFEVAKLQILFNSLEKKKDPQESYKGTINFFSNLDKYRNQQNQQITIEVRAAFIDCIFEILEDDKRKEVFDKFLESYKKKNNLTDIDNNIIKNIIIKGDILGIEYLNYKKEQLEQPNPSLDAHEQEEKEIDMNLSNLFE